MTSKRIVLSTALVLVAGATFATPADACTPAERYAQRRAQVAKINDTSEQVAARYELALWARKSGLDAEARKEFEAVIAADSDHAGARNALGYEFAGGKWYDRKSALEAKGLVQRDGAWMLPEEAAIVDMPATERARRKEEHAKVEKLLATMAGGGERARKFAEEALAGVEARYKLEPLAYGLRSKTAGVRLIAAKELGALKDRRALRPLIHRAIYDPVEEVRFAAIDASKAIGDANLLAPFVTALNSESQPVRINAVNAIGRLGDARGVRYLVYQYEARGGGAPRVHFMDAAQLTFIQDFDVEVAQTAFIADPSVGVIQEGRVLDVQVVATSETGVVVEREAIHGALQNLTGAKDVKNEAGAWAQWYRDNKDSLVAKR